MQLQANILVQFGLYPIVNIVNKALYLCRVQFKLLPTIKIPYT